MHQGPAWSGGLLLRLPTCSLADRTDGLGRGGRWGSELHGLSGHLAGFYAGELVFLLTGCYGECGENGVRRGSSGVVRFLPGMWPHLNSGRTRGANRRCVLKCRPARGRTCCRHTREFSEGRRGSLKPVACGEEACSARPATSGALLAGAPVQRMRYGRSCSCHSNHSP